MDNHSSPSISQLGTAGTFKKRPADAQLKSAATLNFGSLPPKFATRSSFRVRAQRRAGCDAPLSLLSFRSRVAPSASDTLPSLAGNMCAPCARYRRACGTLWSLVLALAVASCTVRGSASPAAAAKGKMYPRGNHWAVGKRNFCLPGATIVGRTALSQSSFIL